MSIAFHPGAQTINAAISLRARALVESRADDRIVIRSLDTGVTIEADHWCDPERPLVNAIRWADERVERLPLPAGCLRLGP